MDARDAVERRISLMLSHALGTAVGVLLLLAVIRAWNAGENPVAATAVAAAMAGCFLLARRRPAGRPERSALVALVLLWALGAWLSAGFAYVALPLYFLVLHGLPRSAGAAALVAVAAWSVWCAGTVLGPVIAAFAAVVATMIFGAQRADAQRHRALVAELREAQAQVAAAEHERGVLAERERLAREIHDTIGQGLASIVVLARTGGDAALPLIESTARENLAEARRVVRALGAPGQIGLVDGLQSLVDDTRRRAAAAGRPVDVELRVDAEPTAVDPRTVQALHRGVQASLANVLQHADAHRCVVGVATFDGRVVVDIADDGRGFDPHAVGTDSFGLRGLEARLTDIGGSVTVETVPGEGTTIGLSAPVQPPARQETR